MKPDTTTQYYLGDANCWWCGGLSTGLDYGAFANGLGPTMVCPECKRRKVSELEYRTYYLNYCARIDANPNKYQRALDLLRMHLERHRWPEDRIEALIAKGGPHNLQPEKNYE